VSVGESGTAPEGTYQGRVVELVLYGPGSAGRWREIPALQESRALLATTRSVARSPVFGDLAALFSPILRATFKDTRQHAPVSAVEQLAERIRESGADVVISLGGGSVIDTAKAAIDLEAGRTGVYLPHVAVPTTLSAAEFAQSYGMTDDQTRRKRRGSNLNLLPHAVILDSRLTVHTPDWLWSGSGLRALDHAVETIYAPDGNPVADALGLEAVSRLFRYLPASVHTDGTIHARQHCQIAAWLSFAANSTITLGPSHRLGRLIGPIYSVPHGFTSAILLPHVMDAVMPGIAPRQDLIVRAAAAGDEASTPASGDAASLVRDLVRRLALPTRLRDVGVPRDELPELAGDNAMDLRVLEAAW